MIAATLDFPAKNEIEEWTRTPVGDRDMQCVTWCDRRKTQFDVPVESFVALDRHGAA